jgi:hypothetical protein
MVMFKAKFKPAPAERATAQQQQQPQQPQPTAPPMEKERGPQYPVKEPGPAHEPERARQAKSERAS